MGICKQLYEALNSDNFKAYLEMAVMKYQETFDAVVVRPYTAQIKPQKKRVPTTSWLLDRLMDYEPVAKYVYANEVERKRDRLAEAVNASKAKAREFDRGLGFWSQMTAHFSDYVSDESTKKAFQDAGVQEVRWNTQRDGKVCKECEDRDGKVFPVNKIPPKPHWGCRCYVTAVRTNKQKFKGDQ